MSGFRGGRSHDHNVRRGYNAPDIPLVKLVEEYLVKFKHMSFINLEHMGEVIRKQSFKYARMKPNVFRDELRKAYQQYSDTANQAMNDFSGGDIEMDNTPLNDDTLNKMEGYPSESDSDLEIDETPINVSKDAGVSQMKNLYMQPTSSASNEVTTRQDHKVPVNGKDGKATKNVDKSDCISVGSSTDASVDNTRTKSVILQGKPVSQDKPKEDNDSGSDLEIIDEVQHDRPKISVITDSYGYPLPLASGSSTKKESKENPPTPTTPLVQPEINSTVGKYGKYGTTITVVNGNSNSNNATVSSTVPQPQTIKKAEAPSRGVKRKAVGMPENEAGINEDLTRKKPKREVTIIKDTGYKLQDFAGSEKVVEEVCKLLMHLKHPEVYQTLGVTPPRGFLLHGPPGTGKTLLANAIAGELQTPLLKVAGTELVSGISGESENNIRELFNQAATIAPCIIFIDEIDSVTPKRENVNKEMERRIVAQLLACIDDLVNKEKGDQVLLIGATNRIEAIDTALRRAGRFDREICLGIPDQTSREKILSIICRDLKVEPGFSTDTLAKLTPGYVGADLQALVREAAVQAVNRKLLSKCAVKEDPAKIESDTNAGVRMDVDEEPSTTDKLETKSDQTSQDKNQEEGDEATGPQSSSTSEPERQPENKSETETKENEKSSQVAGKESNSEPEATKEGNFVPKDETQEKSSEPQGQETVVKQEEKMQVDNSEPDGEIKNDSELVESTSEAPNQQENRSESSTQEEAKSDLNVIPEKSSEQLNKLETLPASASQLDDASSCKSQEEKINPLQWIKETCPLDADELGDLFVTMKDFSTALKNVQPSSKREGFATVPDTTWDDIGALKSIRDELQVSILGPVKHAESFRKLGLTTPAGVLLCGPPGCGKTLLAKAVANEAGINFISVKGPELLNMYVGESERAVRQCFMRARNSSPCVIFFDELDALCPRRSDVADSGSGGRIVNQLLTEMDGIEERQGVFVMAASNRPDIIDPAVLRPGRLDKLLFVNLPSACDRFEILKAITKDSTKPVLADDVNLEEIANSSECDDYSGADLSALVREASIAAFRELVLHAEKDNKNELKVYRRHFDIAFSKTKPSVGKEDRLKYKRMAEKYSTMR